uniref:Cytoplasmic polyadenylation element-binding protein 2-like n=1 Tax=Phallusia mammillata TaxID=59560 RepID=A0A6F9DAI3_9ASCI|nr:cytoplasmic polyadenylation element-binding protein 2-like [Phallusia mammillata]
MDHYSRSRSRESSRGNTYERYNNYSSRIHSSSSERKHEDADHHSSWNEGHSRTQNDIDDVNDEAALYFTDCILYPPQEGIDRPYGERAKKKPIGCKTIYVGGFPDPLRHSLHRVESILHEVFTTNGGKIDSIRSNNRGFCHIRFEKTESVEMALSVHGYSMLIKQDRGTPFKFRLTVDYSESHGDWEEYEARQVIAKKLHLDSCPISSVPGYNVREADKVQQNLKSDEKFEESVVILRYWLNSGAMERQKSDTFYNLLQVTHAQVKRLDDEKTMLKSEFDEIKNRFKKRTGELEKMFDHLVKLYEDAKKQKCWDRFTRAQRKSIDGWLNTAKENLPAPKPWFGMKRQSTEMDIVDQEKQDSKNAVVAGFSHVKRIKTENKDQQTDVNETEQYKEFKISNLEENLQHMRQQVWELVSKMQMKDTTIQTYQEEIEALKQAEDKKDATKMKKQKEKVIEEKDVKLACMVANFLRIHPNGAAEKMIFEYLCECDINITMEKVCTLLKRFPTLFIKHSKSKDDDTNVYWTVFSLNEVE